MSRLPILAAGAAILAVATVGLALVLVPAGAYLPDLAQVVGDGLAPCSSS